LSRTIKEDTLIWLDHSTNTEDNNILVNIITNDLITQKKPITTRREDNNTAV